MMSLHVNDLQFVQQDIAGQNFSGFRIEVNESICEMRYIRVHMERVSKGHAKGIRASTFHESFYFESMPSMIIGVHVSNHAHSSSHGCMISAAGKMRQPG